MARDTAYGRVAVKPLTEHMHPANASLHRWLRLSGWNRFHTGFKFRSLSAGLI
jgi:hypothetical protein